MIDLKAVQTLILDHLHDGAYIVDRERRVQYWNKAACRVSGYDARRMVGSFCYENTLVHVDSSGRQLCREGCPLSASLADGQIRQADVFLHHREGYRVPVAVQVLPLRDETGEIAAALELFHDLSSERNLAEEVEHLRQAALIDPLTDLGNRRFLDSLIGRWFDEARDFRQSFGVLFFDVDHFKRVNDVYGHDVGDQALRAVASTLARNVRATDVVGRWGGEEFVALIKNTNPDLLLGLAEKLRVLIAQTRFEVGGEPRSVTASIGGTVWQDGDTPEGLLRRADEMMYRSKAGGRNRTSIG